MRREVAAVVILIMTGLSGCLDDPDDGTSSIQAAPGGPTSSAPGTAGANDDPGAPPTVDFTASTLVGRAPLVVAFDVRIEDPEGAPVTFALDANGDNIADFTGAGPTSSLEYNYTAPGQYVATLTASDGAQETVQSLNITVTPGASDELPPPIIINGHIDAAFGGCYVLCFYVIEPEHPFELNTLVNNITATITWSDTVVDLDWELEMPDGTLAHQERGQDLAQVDGSYADPLIVTSAAHLANFGTWTIRVQAGPVVMGDYEITVTFR